MFRGKGKALTCEPPQQPVFGAASKAKFGGAPQGLCIPLREAPTGVRASWRREPDWVTCCSCSLLLLPCSCGHRVPQARQDPAPRVRACSRPVKRAPIFLVGEHVEPAAPSRGPQPPSPCFQGGFGCTERHLSPVTISQASLI